MKPTNPKDIIGNDKVPLHLWPESASVQGALALLDGTLKYGRLNWRVHGVRASVYVDALRRHMAKWWEGEDLDQDSGLSHLAHALACLAILVDAQVMEKLNDDRAFPGGIIHLMDEASNAVKTLRRRHQGKKPKHYTIQDIKNAESSKVYYYHGRSNCKSQIAIEFLRNIGNTPRASDNPRKR